MSSDYIFKKASSGGLEFVGDFDGLYASEPDPWCQSGSDYAYGEYYFLSRTRIVEAIRSYAPTIRNAIEVGCGHGHALNDIAAKTSGHWRGMDISRNAIIRAEALYPHLSYDVADISSDRFPLICIDRERYDVVLLNQILWYILENFDNALNNALTMLKPGGLLIISQAYLRSEQKFGRDIADGFIGTLTAILNRCPSLTLLCGQYCDGSHGLIFNDGLLVFRKKAQ
jgi:SAM-dependent methyltransferase